MKGKTEIGLSDVARMAQAGVNGIRERGKADVGDKTMLDAVVPWAEALERSEAEGKSLAEALSVALEAAEAGHAGYQGNGPEDGARIVARRAHEGCAGCGRDGLCPDDQVVDRIFALRLT